MQGRLRGSVERESREDVERDSGGECCEIVGKTDERGEGSAFRGAPFVVCACDPTILSILYCSVFLHLCFFYSEEVPGSCPEISLLLWLSVYWESGSG